MALTEEQARRNLASLMEKYHALSAADREQMTEASVVRQFVDQLLGDVLDWPIDDPVRYKYELRTTGGRPDLTLIPERGAPIFVEAKRFGVIKELQESRQTITGVITPGQLALPGMATDRTAEEQQAINYAFQNNAQWAILTNFEKLRLFNARRDWLVLSFEKPIAYVDDFDLLWRLAYPNVINGSLDELSSMRHTGEVDTVYLAFINEWRERLAQDIVQHREHNPWAFQADGGINLTGLRSVVQRFLDRLVVIRFAEDHLVVHYGVLRDLYDVGRNNPYFNPGLMLREFFRRFDQQHNSALFAPDVVDEAVFSDEVLLPLIGKLYDARYRSMPADIMGNTYEQYLGQALALDNGSVATRDNLETRKKQGSYYTPQVLVRYLVDHSLGRYLYATADGQPDGEPLAGEARKTSRDLRQLRVLDAACGSGSFLIYAYEVLAGFYQAEIERLEAEALERAHALAGQGMTPFESELELAGYKTEIERIRDYPRLILETHLYGVDLDPQAAEIATVNLIMRAMERRSREKRLPLILNQNIKVGNALIGLRPDDSRLAGHAPALADLIRLRAALVSTPHGPEHERILTDLEAADAALTAELDAALADYFTDVGRVRPFHWGAEFPEVFFEADGTPKEDGGFTVVIGNPPWEIVKPDLREFYAQFDADIESKLSRRQVEARIAALNAEDPRRVAQWEAQTRLIEESAAYYRACGDFTRQGRGDTATHKLFVERVYDLLGDGGRLGYLVPSGIYTDLGTKELRVMLLDEGRIEYVFSFSNERFFFPGVDHRFKFAMLGAQKGAQGDGFWAAFRFNPRVAVAPGDLPAFLADRANLIYMRRKSLERFSPEDLSVMEFQSRQDYEITEKIFAAAPSMSQMVDDAWNPQFVSGLHKTNHREYFNVHGNGLPVYEGKNLGFYGKVLASPSIWIDEKMGSSLQSDYSDARFGFRRIANSTNIRTLIVSYVPPMSFTMYTLTTIRQGEVTKPQEMFLYGCMASFVLDYLIRFQVAASVAIFNVNTLPMPRLTSGNPYFDEIVPRAARLTCTRPEFAALWEAVTGEAWDADQAATAPEARQALRAEIDALVAHLYGLSRADFDHILGTFPLVFPASEEGRRKRESLLAVYDDWAARVREWPRR